MQGRRGTWYHNTNPQLQHQTSVADLVAHKRFSTLKFAFSAAGIMKVVVIVLFLIAGIIFLVNKVCPSTPSWYTWLYPLITLVIAVTTAIMYTFFMLGMAEDNPDPWVKMDLSALGLATVVSVAISIVTITSCDSTETQHVVPGPLGLVGAFMLAVSAAAMYITWKYREEEPAVPSALAVELAENSPA